LLHSATGRVQQPGHPQIDLPVSPTAEQSGLSHLSWLAVVVGVSSDVARTGRRSRRKRFLVMIAPPVPAWKKWVMLGLILSFVILATIFFRARRAARERAPDRVGPPASKPTR